MRLKRDKKRLFLKNQSVLVAGVGVLLYCSVSIAHGNSPGFRVEIDATGKYWIVDADGEQFLTLGVNNIGPCPWQPKPDTQYYNPVPTYFGGDYEAWKTDVLGLLERHGFNTLGAWSDGRLYDGSLYGTVCLYVAGYAEDRCLDGLRPGFEDRVKENVRMMLASYPYLDNVFGVFLDNEMSWYGHAPWGDIPNYTLLEQALSLPREDAARQAAVAFLKERYGTAEALSKAWGAPLSSWDDLTFAYARGCLNAQTRKDRNDFIRLAADAFYKTSADVVRRMLPGKLILGTRYAEYAPQPVIEACGRYCDIISFNHYTGVPKADEEMLARYWIWGGQTPLMITEFSWRAEENTSGNPNTGGAGAVVRTQAERADNYSRYVEDLLSWPMVVGVHWFEFADQSPQGRFDGENSNYGIVDIYHRPYEALLSAMKQTHSRIERLHAESPRSAPTALPKPRAVVFEPGQYPQRPASIDLLVKESIKAPELFSAPDAQIRLEKSGEVLWVHLDTGNQWGCGVLFYGPRDFKTASGPSFATDLGGYMAIEIDAVIGKNIVFELLLDEAGVGAVNAASYDTSGGDDGEAFSIPSIQGSGSREIYRFDLRDLELRTSWGNQRGLRRVDIASMKGIGLHFFGGQGKETIEIYALRLTR